MCQAFLAETVETGDKNHCVIEATHVVRRKLTFPKRVGPRILCLKVLITLEQVNTTEWSKKMRILINETAMVGCCKLSFYAIGSCDEHAIYFRR